jgi:hypothetical protein
MFKVISIKIPMTFITEIKKINPKVHLEAKMTMNNQAILSKKSNAGGITIPDLKLYYRDIAIKTAWYWYTHTHTHTHQTNKQTNKQR